MTHTRQNITSQKTLVNILLKINNRVQIAFLFPKSLESIDLGDFKWTVYH